MRIVTGPQQTFVPADMLTSVVEDDDDMDVLVSKVRACA
jgi:hypothetical protein